MTVRAQQESHADHDRASLSTILEADRILVFDHGRIVEQGTRAELIEKEGGVYESLFRLQSGGFIAD